MDFTSRLEEYFSVYRRHIIGNQQYFASPYGSKRVVYADWTASGRAYGPIETRLREDILPYFANTHTVSTVTGAAMSTAYEEAKEIVKAHVNAAQDDVLLFCGSGMTDAVNKLQRILGLRLPERAMDYAGSRAEGGMDPAGSPPEWVRECTDCRFEGGMDPAGYLPLEEVLRPLILLTHMEHHSNHISWLETIATVEIIRPCANGNVDLDHLRKLLEQYRDRKNKIAAVTACSNVTGIETPYHEIAALMHACGGLCFVDFACSAPYVSIDMHPGAKSGGYDDAPVHKAGYLDALYFSCHKFLGGPGTPGVLIFNKKLYANRIPDRPGGGTILYSNPWGGHAFVADIEQREDGGTPPILQGIKAALCIRLKEEMGIKNILRREAEMVSRFFDGLVKIPRVEILEEGNRQRLGVLSFVITGAHYGLIVKILNDRFGIQARGGCNCAGPYGHWLLGIDAKRSQELLNLLQAGEFFCKPGWVRMSLHPTMTDAEIDYLVEAVAMTAAEHEKWSKEYVYEPDCNEFVFSGAGMENRPSGKDWFKIPLV